MGETENKKERKKVLGRGISALFAEIGDLENMEKEEESEIRGIKEVKLDEIKPSEYQPRYQFDSEKLEELAQSIKEKGIIQPIIVRNSDSGYEIIAGERRFRAASMAGLDKIPVVIKEVSSDEAIEIALIENIQREDLNPIEEAKAYQRLIDEFKLTQEDLAFKVGKNRTSITNVLRLLKLPTEIQKAVEENIISMGHARALINVEEKKLQLLLFKKVVKKNLSVRQIEDIIKTIKNVSRETIKNRTEDPIVKSYERILMESLGTKVFIKQNKDKKSGKIEIIYFSLDDIERILEKLEK
ncbi:MAG: ParB/RepB/Spo0J family partition protein [bacterium]|nr:ParB/RepB/Spo0J family partition protein [bacterium]